MLAAPAGIDCGVNLIIILYTPTSQEGEHSGLLVLGFVPASAVLGVLQVQLLAQVEVSLCWRHSQDRR